MNINTPTISKVPPQCGDAAYISEILSVDDETNSTVAAHNLISLLGAFNYNNLNTPKFSQPGSNHGYDQRTWDILINFTNVQSEGLLAHEQASVNEFLDTAFPILSDSFIGTGTFAGQFGRMAKGIRVAAMTKADGEFFHSVYYSDDRMLEILQEVMPRKFHNLNIHGIDPFSIAERDEASSFGGSHTIPLMNVNASAHSGPPWNGMQKRPDTLIQDLCLAMRTFASYNADDRAFDTDNKYFQWLRLSHIKAKSEVQNFSECFFKKNRNIFPYSAPGSILLSPLQKVSHEGLENFLSIGDTGRLLYGIPMCTTGLGGIYIEMLSEAAEKGRSTTFYADNIHILEFDSVSGYRYVSIDLQSEEARNTADDAYMCIKHILEHTFRDSQGKLSGVSQRYYEFLTQVMPRCLIDGVGILGNSQFDIPGMPSGCPLTFDINSTATAPAVYAIQNNSATLLNNDGTPNHILDEIMKSHALPYKVESHLDNTEFTYPRTSPFSLSTVGKITTINILGFDICSLIVRSNTNMFTPIPMLFAVLSEKRFIKMLFFDKSTFRREDNRPEIILIRDNLMKLIVAYLLLGGFLPHRAPAVLALVSARVHRLRELLDAPTGSLETLLGIDDESFLTALADVLKGLGLSDDAARTIQGTLKEVVGSGLINFASVVRMTQESDVYNEFLRCAAIDPDSIPQTLLDYRMDDFTTPYNLPE